jgi:glyoxylase-like metal-dependent hydrolase (beta-lactamase superfamily II)
MPDFVPVTPHIGRLEVPWRMVGLIPSSVCVWLIRVGDRWTMVDSGPPEAADMVVAAVARATRGRGPQTILLTHAHYDHAGGLEALRAAWDPAILCHREEVGFVTGQSDYRHLPSRGLWYSIGRLLMGSTRWQLPVARDLERGQAVEGMAIIHLPGHTPGHIGFLHPEDRAMLCGDAVMNVGGRLSPSPALATQDPAAARSSLGRLGDLDYEHLLPSHGRPILGGGRAALARWLGGAHPEPPHTRW